MPTQHLQSYFPGHCNSLLGSSFSKRSACVTSAVDRKMRWGSHDHAASFSIGAASSRSTLHMQTSDSQTARIFPSSARRSTYAVVASTSTVFGSTMSKISPLLIVILIGPSPIARSSVCLSILEIFQIARIRRGGAKINGILHLYFGGKNTDSQANPLLRPPN